VVLQEISFHFSVNLEMEECIESLSVNELANGVRCLVCHVLTLSLDLISPSSATVAFLIHFFLPLPVSLFNLIPIPTSYSFHIFKQFIHSIIPLTMDFLGDIGVNRRRVNLSGSSSSVQSRSDALESARREREQRGREKKREMATKHLQVDIHALIRIHTDEAHCISILATHLIVTCPLVVIYFA
jgi:hypothetical protein